MNDIVYQSRPLHKTVDWSMEKLSTGNKPIVMVTCPICQQIRWLSCPQTAHSIRNSTFTGLCRIDARSVNRIRKPFQHKPRPAHYGNNPLLQHPAVDWSTEHPVSSGCHHVVTVTCPICHITIERSAAEVASTIKHGTFSGRCFKDRLIGKKKASTHNDPTPLHSQVDWNTQEIRLSGNHRLMHVQITCPKCGLKRWAQAVSIRGLIYANKFTGLCPSCAGLDKGHEWVILGPGRKIKPTTGYVYIDRRAIAPEHMWLFRAMRKTQSSILEHRLTMAIHLNRPLEIYELVDHMDGVKTHNTVDNLRLYLRGKNMPGSQGYGTYYHEWQIALIRIHELETQLTLIAPPS